MLNLAANMRIFLAVEPTDMRKGFDGLFALVESVIQQDPFSGEVSFSSALLRRQARQ